MLSHHAPPKRLLQNFTSPSSDQPKLWVYSKDRRARPVYKITAESAENGYFSKDPEGRSEEEIDRALNEAYEAPFNRLLPSFNSGLVDRFDASLTDVCSNYVAGLFLRSKPRREAIKAHTKAFNLEFSRRISDRLTLRRYAAKISFHTGLPVSLDQIRTVSEKHLKTDEDTEDVFFQSATTSFSQLPRYLRESHWAICESPHLNFIQSDVAVALMNVTAKGGIRVGTGTSLHGSQWFLPITPRLAIRASADYIPQRTLAPHFTDCINEFMVRAAHTFVYSSSYSPEVEAFTRDNLFTLHFFRNLITTDVKAEVDQLLMSLLLAEA